LLGAALLATAPLPVAAQNLFQVVARVNDKAITRYELDQRIRLMEVLRTPGDLNKVALNALIEERLQVGAASRAGITPTADEIKAGIDEFATRANLTGDQMIAQLGGAGVAAESFRDFVVAGLSWRNLIRSRFGPRVTISDAELETAIAAQGQKGSAEVLISEIYLPADTPEAAAQNQPLADELAKIRSFDAFASAARQYSAGATAQVGGRVSNWVPLTNLPPQIAGLLLTMKPGEVSAPITIPNAIALFQLRSLREVPAPAPKNVSVDYAQYFIAGGRSEAGLAAAAKVAARVDGCDDLYGVAKGQDPQLLERQKLPMGQVPQNIAIELAKLDPGEYSTALTSADGQTLIFLMLCSRTTATADGANRDTARQALFSNTLAGYAQVYLAELKANAVISFQ